MNDPQAASPYPPAGEVLDGKYRVEKLLGEGGMGAVARATHLLLHRTVAVKFMNPQFMTFPGAVERFLNEGRASGAIRSEHVVPVSDVGCLPSGTPYLVMECLYGLDLADLLARDGPSGLPIQRAVHFLLQILRGLQAAHAIGIIHRDMKPSNCFVVNHDGEDDFVKILDFGISKIAQPGSASLTQTNSALGTPLYMSPEQARSPRDVDARSDLYSVGVILYELLCGHTPFFSESGEFTEILFQLFTADPPPIKTTRPDLPDDLAVVVHKALAREVPDRYVSSLEFAEALVPFAGEASLDIVEKMRAYQPPSFKSVVPTDGLPTSMAAFSQLQKHSTDVMVNRPTTDVQQGAPVTAVIVNVPGSTPVAPKAATEMLRQAPAPAKQPTALLPPSSRSPGASAKSAVQTDLGASRDMAGPEPSAGQKRSPIIFVLPVFAVFAIAGIVLIATSAKKGDTTTGKSVPTETALPPASSPSPSSTPSAAVGAGSASVQSPEPDVSVASTPSAAPSTSASAAAHASGHRNGQLTPGQLLGTGLHQ